MPEVYNWQLGRKMLYPTRSGIRSGSCLCVQHQSLFGLSDLFHGRQVDLALLEGAGVHGGTTWKPSRTAGVSQFYDVKITQLIEQVNPGGQVWNVRVGRKHHARRTGCSKE